MPLGRRQRAHAPSPDAAPGTGMLACPLCGEVVPVGEDGRCDLGHRVFVPPSASERTQPLALPEEPGAQDEHGESEPADTGAAGVPVAPVAGQAAEGLSLAREPADTEEGPDEDGTDEDGPPDLDLTRELDW